MRVLVFSCLHLHPFRAFATYSRGDNSRRLEVLERWNEIVEIGNQPQYDAVLCAGDFFQEKTRVDVVSVSKAKAILSHLRKPLIACSGTHDITRSGYSSLSVFSETVSHPGSVINEMEAFAGQRGFYHDGIVRMGNWLFLCIPTQEQTALQQAIESVANRVYSRMDSKILLTHGDVQGSWLRGNMRVERGLDPRFLARRFSFSIVGHYHESRLFERVLVPGTCSPHSFSDEGLSGAVWDVNLLDDHNEVIEIPFYHPLFKTVDLDENPDFSFNVLDYYRILTSNRDLRRQVIASLPPEVGARSIIIYKKPQSQDAERAAVIPQAERTELLRSYVGSKFLLPSSSVQAERLYRVGLMLAREGVFDEDSVCEQLEKLYQE
jgi:DNA repair exonuclease SbcCD nuclease subunit